MKLSSAVVSAGSSLLTSRDANTNSIIDHNSAPPNLTTLPYSSLFNTWRPKAHVLPPQGQINDPCMHYVESNTGLFHVGFLHSPGAAGATTSNLITYEDVNPNGAPFIVNGSINDPTGVFDGSVIAEGIDGKPTLLYTSNSYLPIHWTIPYKRGGETQSLAVNYDGESRNFTKLDQGPVIPGPPFAVNVTGWRDPFVFENAVLDRATGSPEGTRYVIISGGVHDDGPSQFLYRQYSPDFQYWEELGQWWHESANTTWDSENYWGVRFGFNFEAGNVIGLDEQGYNSSGQVFNIFSVEWSQTPIVPQKTQFHDQLWAAGSVELVDGSPKFQPQMAGQFDCGRAAYAAAGKELPAWSQPSQNSGAPDRFISYIWLTGNYFESVHAPEKQQNWTGALLLPRELSVGRISNVVDNSLSRVDHASWTVTSNASGIVELSTLKQHIAREPLAALKNSSNSYVETGRTLNSNSSSLSSPVVIPFSRSPSDHFYTLTASISFPSSARQSKDIKAGFQILAGQHESTSLYYQFSNESLIVELTNSSAAASTTDGIFWGNEAGRLRLFDMVDDGRDEQFIETLDLTVVVDNSILEIYANDRFALSTWVKPWYDDSNEIRFFLEGEGEATFSNVTVYEGLYDAWPKRSGA